MPISEARRREVVSEFKIHPTDSGSPEVQVALLTENIRDLTEHLKDHKHDFSGKRGLIAMVSKRTSLTTYLKRLDHDRYTKLIGRLGLRK